MCNAVFPLHCPQVTGIPARVFLTVAATVQSSERVAQHLNMPDGDTVIRDGNAFAEAPVHGTTAFFWRSSPTCSAIRFVYRAILVSLDLHSKNCRAAVYVSEGDRRDDFEAADHPSAQDHPGRVHGMLTDIKLRLLKTPVGCKCACSRLQTTESMSDPCAACNLLAGQGEGGGEVTSRNRL